MQKDLTLESLDKSLEQSKRAELKKQQQRELESMKELAKSLRASLQTELSSIEDDMTKKLKFLREKMTEERRAIFKDEKETLKTLTNNRKAIERESQSLMQSLNRIKLRYWIVPLIVGVSLILGLTLGTYLLGSWITSQAQDLRTLRAEIAKTEKTKDKYIIKSWNNGIGVRKQPSVFKSMEEGLWIVQFEKTKG